VKGGGGSGPLIFQTRKQNVVAPLVSKLTKRKVHFCWNGSDALGSHSVRPSISFKRLTNSTKATSLLWWRLANG